RVRVRLLAHDKTSNLPRLIAIHLVDGPGPFEMESRFQDGACAALPAEVFQQYLLVRVDDDEGGREEQCAELEQNDQQDRIFKKVENPRLGDFESELVIQRLGRGGDQAAGLAEQTNEAAFVEEARRLTLDARPINLQHKTHEGFDGGQPEDDRESVTDR